MLDILRHFNFDFLEIGLGLISMSHFRYGFLGKMFLMLYSINSLAEKGVVNDPLQLNTKFLIFYSSYFINMLCTGSSMINQMRADRVEVTALHTVFCLTSD